MSRATTNSDQVVIFFCSADATYQASIDFNGVNYTSRWFSSGAVAVLHALEMVQVRNPELTFALLGHLPVAKVP
jgi:hypothetical protein